MYPFQLLGWSSSPVGLHVAIGMGEVISGSLDFDWGIVPVTEVILVSILVCRPTTWVWQTALIPVLSTKLLDRSSTEGADPQADLDD